MVDMELILYNEIHDALSDVDVELQVYDKTFTPTTKTPLVIVDLTNSAQSRTVELNEPYSDKLTFTINVFTNGNKRISDGKLICGKISDIMLKNGFKRVSMQRLPDFMHKEVCRYFLTYTAHITVDNLIY